MDGESCERKPMATTTGTTLTVNQARRGWTDESQLINQCPVSIYGSDARRRNHSSRGDFTTRLFTTRRRTPQWTRIYLLYALSSRLLKGSSKLDTIALPLWTISRTRASVRLE